MDYFNPASGLPNPETTANMPGGGFWTGLTQANNQATMAPFVANELAQRNLALQRSQAQFAEEQSPTAVAARKTGKEIELTKNQQLISQLPILGQIDAQAHKNQFELMPAQQKIAVEKAANELRDAKNAPMLAQRADIAGVAAKLHATPDPMKPAIYEREMQAIQAKYPDMPIDPSLMKFSPTNQQYVETQFQGAVHSVATEQKLAEKAPELKKDIEVANIRAKAGLGEAGIREAGAMAREKFKAENDYRNANPGQAQQSDMKLLDSPSRLQAYAKANGFSSVEEAKSAIQNRIDSRRQDMNAKTALELTKVRMQNAIMPGSPDAGKAAGDIYQEELSRLSGPSKAPAKSMKPSDARAQAEAAIAKGAPRDAVAARFKKLTGEDL